MAITSEKLLNRPSELHRRYGGRLAMQKALQEKMVSGGPSNVVLTKKSIKNIEGIKVNVIKIENILKGTLSAEKKSLDDKKRLESGKRREKQEEKLETKPQAEKGKIKTPQIPRMGFLDWVKNFIGNVILGYFAVRMLDYLPKLIPIVKFLGSATDFVINTGGKLLDGLITFVDWGYKAIDATSGFIEKIGGSGAADNFGKFLGLIDNALFLTTTIAGAMAVEALTSDSGGPGDIVGDQITKRVLQKGAQQAATSAAGQAGGAAQAGGLGAGAVAGIVAGAGLLASALGEGAFQVRKFAVKPIQKLENDQKNDKNPLTRIGRGVVLNMARPLFGLFQTVGFLLDIVGAPFRYAVELLRYPFLSEEDKVKQANNLAKFDARIREDLRKALNMLTFGLAFKEKGSFGNIYGNKGAQKEMMGKMAGGGITRGGKAQTGARRTIGGDKKKGKYKRALARKPSKTQFKGDPKDPLVKTGQELDKTKYFGPVLAVSTKLEAKEEPTQKDYDNVGLGLNLLIAKGLEEGQLKGGLVAAFAGGGMVDDEFLEAAEKGVDVSSWISKTFRTEFETNAQKTLRQIKERKEKKDGAAGVPGAGTPGSPDMINIQGGDVDFWTLVAVASREDGEPQAWSDVAQSIYNRLASGAYTGKTIKDLILGQMQYEPTWKFPKPGVTGKPNQEWYAIKDAASAGIAAGQSEGAMKKVAAAILDPTLQKNAREFIQGRTDFRGYSVSGGVQRKAGDNYYGWYNNYRANKVGSVPNFGATATSTGAGPGGGTFVGGGTGSGYGTGGVKIAGDLGDYMKANKGKIGVTGEIHQHPRHPGQKRRNYFSYHNQNRALDIGGWGPAHPSSGGRDEQAPVIRALLEWNKKNGYQPVEIIHGSPAFKGLGKYESAPNALHSNHVHVAYALGGRVRKPTYAVVGDKGPEFIFDADTTAGLDRLAPGILEKLNVAKTKPQLASILQSYATYEQPYGDTQIVEVPVEVPVSVGGDSYESSGSPMVFSGNRDNPFDTLYQGG
jgi:hypothetical protein